MPSALDFLQAPKPEETKTSTYKMPTGSVDLSVPRVIVNKTKEMAKSIAPKTYEALGEAKRATSPVAGSIANLKAAGRSVQELALQPIARTAAQMGRNIAFAGADPGFTPQSDIAKEVFGQERVESLPTELTELTKMGDELAQQLPSVKALPKDDPTSLVARAGIAVPLSLLSGGLKAMDLDVGAGSAGKKIAKEAGEQVLKKAIVSSISKEITKGSKKAIDELSDVARVDLFETIDDFVFKGTSTMPAKDLGKFIKGDVTEFKVDPKKLQSMFSNERSTSENVVKKYTEAMKHGDVFPPILVANGRFLDGGHRVKAAINAGVKKISAIDVTNIVNDAIKFGKDEGFKTVKSLDEVGDIVTQKSPAVGVKTAEAFQGFDDLSLKTLEKLKGRTTVSRQFIEDLAKAPDLKQAERDIIGNVLADVKGDKVSVKNFADTVKTELLPLKIVDRESSGGGGTRNIGRYEHVSLPDNLKGEIESYGEHIYESPIKTSAGDVHFSGTPGAEGYFGHTRVEDLPDETRRVIEVQSDLFQRGRLEREGVTESSKGVIELNNKELQSGIGYDGKPLTKKRRNELIKNNKEHEANIKSTGRLEQYSNPTAHFRMIREEVKRAAQDGKTKLQFPTGETAARIEGFVGDSAPVPMNASVGDIFGFGGEDYHVLSVDNNTRRALVVPDRAIVNRFDVTDYLNEEIANTVSDRWKYDLEYGLDEFVNTLRDMPINDAEMRKAQDQFFKAPDELVKFKELIDTNDPLVDLVAENQIVTNELGGHNPRVDSERYDAAVAASEYFEENFGTPHTASNGDVLVLDEGASTEWMGMGGKGDNFNVDDLSEEQQTVYKFYDKEVQKYLKNKYGAKQITDPQGVTWFEVDIKPEMGKAPVEAFAAVPIGAGMMLREKQENAKDNKRLPSRIK